MSIESIISEYQDIWDDCCFGYVIIDNEFGKNEIDSVRSLVSVEREFNFYPWLNERETLQLKADTLVEIDREEFCRLFVSMARDAIAYGSEKRLSYKSLMAIVTEFVSCFDEARYFTSFNKSGWRPVTMHSCDRLLCVSGKNKIGMWLSCDDE